MNVEFLLDLLEVKIRNQRYVHLNFIPKNKQKCIRFTVFLLKKVHLKIRFQFSFTESTIEKKLCLNTKIRQSAILRQA